MAKINEFVINDMKANGKTVRFFDLTRKSELLLIFKKVYDILI